MKKKVSVISRHPSHKGFDLPKFNKSVRVRFGSVTQFPSRKQIEFPNIEDILKTSNKVKMKRIFQESGVSSPTWAFVTVTALRTMVDTSIVPDNLNSLFVIADNKPEPIRELIFKEKNHSRGEGIMFVENNDDIHSLINNGKDGYLEVVVGNKREFRVHVFDSEVIYIDEKKPRERGHVARIKNLANGYKYREPKREYPEAIKTEAVKAVEAIGITFGAVDVSMSSDGEVNVFEVNSAPGLRSRTKKIYREAIIKFIEKSGGVIVE